MAKVVDIRKERDRRAVAEFMKEAKNFKGFKHDLDMYGKDVTMCGHAMGGKDDTRMSIIVYSTDEKGYAKPLGAIRVNPEQWKKLVKCGNEMLGAHLSVFALLDKE
jgi:hypothetical protein